MIGGHNWKEIEENFDDCVIVKTNAISEFS